MDKSFAPSISPDTEIPLLYIEDMVLQADGKIVIAGSFTEVNGLSRPGIARLNPDGSVDMSFKTAMIPAPNPPFPLGPPARHAVATVVLQPDQKLLLSNVQGMMTQGNQSLPRVFRLNPDGSIDESLKLKPIAYDEYGVQLDGKILAAYWQTDNPFNVMRWKTGRLLPDGAPDPSFIPSTRSSIPSI